MAISNPADTTEELVSGASAGASKSWNWHPAIPIGYSPLFEFPPNPVRIVRHFVRAWLPLTEFTCYLLLAMGVWFWLQPPLAETMSFSADWIVPMWLRNIAMMSVIATGLHLWLHTWRKQGDAYRYMRNLPTGKDTKFFGGTQLRDNVFWTLASGVTVWTFYEAIMWISYANGVATIVTFKDRPGWFVLLFLLIPVWQSFHFFCIHRLLHWKPIYDRIHSVHHRNITIGPWSGFSMHPVEHLLYLSSLFILLLVPSHPLHMLFLAHWLALATATSHSGFEKLIVGNSYETTIAVFHHQLHHRYFTCNYGNVEMPMDRWFGSHNDGTSSETRRLQAEWVKTRKTG